MRKVLSLSCFLFVSFFAFAQEQNIKVAILETVDRGGNVEYAYKLMLRSNLAKAITNTPGYEAYDRTDMDAIMSEHDFQRTGLVSEDQIKRLGEMTGASYVLVAEAAKADDQMFITAKIINVETAKTEKTDNFLMGATPEDIQQGCIKLSYKLLGVEVADVTGDDHSAVPEIEGNSCIYVRKSGPMDCQIWLNNVSIGSIKTSKIIVTPGYYYLDALVSWYDPNTKQRMQRRHSYSFTLTPQENIFLTVSLFGVNKSDASKKFESKKTAVVEFEKIR